MPEMMLEKAGDRALIHHYYYRTLSAGAVIPLVAKLLTERTFCAIEEEFKTDEARPNGFGPPISCKPTQVQPRSVFLA